MTMATEPLPPIPFDREMLTDDENEAIQSAIGIMGCWASDPDDEATVYEVASRQARSIVDRYTGISPYRRELEAILVEIVRPEHFPCA